MRAQLMFDRDPLSHGIVVTGAIVALEQPASVSWPLGGIQNGLTYCYNESLAFPRLHVVRDGQSIVGYLIRPEELHSSQVDNLFWKVLLEAERAVDHGDRYDFQSDANIAAEGWDDQLPAAAIAFRHGGLPFPTAAVTDAIQLLMGQGNWPTEAALWPYPVRAGSSAAFSGLWITTKQDNLDDPDNAGKDDAEFVRIRNTNGGWSFRDKYPEYRPKEYNL